MKAYFIQQCCEKQCTNQHNDRLVEGILISGNELLDCNENQLSLCEIFALFLFKKWSWDKIDM